jgi:hypothetical protein
MAEITTHNTRVETIICVKEFLASLVLPSHSFSEIIALHQVQIITPIATIMQING